MTDKLKIGLMDLLTILLPGTILLLLFIPENLENIVSTLRIETAWQLVQDKDWLFVSVFIGAAYILGHFVYFLAARLDGLVYEKVKRIYWPEHNLLVAHILKRKIQLTGIEEKKVINAWKWSCAWLIANKPGIYSEVERYMAESKFFRSLVIVSVITFLSCLVNWRGWISLLLVIVICLLSLVRYLTQRQKSIEVAYHGIISTSKEPMKPEPDPEILAELESKLIYPDIKNNLKLGALQAIGINSSWYSDVKMILLAGWHSVSKFFYAIGLCLIPGFERLCQARTTGTSPVYKSVEMRWFTKKPKASIVNWFSKQAMEFRTATPRSDLYVNIPDQTGLTIKQREGNMEIKQRFGGKGTALITPQIPGYRERWTKWSLNTSKKSRLVKRIVKENKQGWIRVDKRRLGKKAVVGNDGTWNYYDMQEILEQGCQIEYTELKVNGETWYSFALEWFGQGKPYLDTQAIREIMGDEAFEFKDSMSYAGFLHQMHS